MRSIEEPDIGFDHLERARETRNRQTERSTTFVASVSAAGHITFTRVDGDRSSNERVAAEAFVTVLSTGNVVTEGLALRSARFEGVVGFSSGGLVSQDSGAVVLVTPSRNPVGGQSNSPGGTVIDQDAQSLRTSAD